MTIYKHFINHLWCLFNVMLHAADDKYIQKKKSFSYRTHVSKSTYNLKEL